MKYKRTLQNFIKLLLSTIKLPYYSLSMQYLTKVNQDILIMTIDNDRYFLYEGRKKGFIAHFQHIPLNVTFKLVQTVIDKHIELQIFTEHSFSPDPIVFPGV